MVAFVAVIVVEVRAAIFAAVAVSASAMTVVKRPSVEKKFVVVAFVVVERSKEAPPLNEDDAETMRPTVVVGESAPFASSNVCPKFTAVPPLPVMPSDDVATRSYVPDEFPSNTFPYVGELDVPLRWSCLFGQFFRFDEWILCRG